ncbi:Bug family tripartite tricarboxylate transporter substrate binding protein [Microvirga splendida]|uniref:Tripartite tricarboxylate transporter substrate binding protein n=1 Tax=Microvirga splendida TaxID=2795727 RepID=A0ABS0XXM2_9HYPH|nr:tripartite tricarboxylate transporter substrate binding protein [Microvirga splendida]MBJ6124799.1 tripartite tricarboxylate transporter substrate binding protein [Microvirga splendida]
MTQSVTRRLALGLFAGAALFASAASAQDFPNRVIKMVVPYPAGGPTDVIARIVAEEMGKELGQNVIVENLAGASGAVGTRAVAKADPDGYTIIFGNNQTHGNNMFLLKEPGYDAVKDFAPLAGAGAFEHVFVVKNDLPVKSMQELIALAKKDPGKLNYGSTGVGSGSHLATELFMTRTGTKMTHVPFRGAAPLVTELMGGRIDVSNSTLPSVLSQFQAGQMRAIGIASPQRNPQAPDVPTLREQGITNADAESWAAFFAPANTPKPVLDKLSSTIVGILNKPEVKDRINKIGFTLNVREPEAFKPYLDKEIQTWAEIIKTAGIEAQ